MEGYSDLEARGRVLSGKNEKGVTEFRVLKKVVS